jgi:hypothetical protein
MSKKQIKNKSELVLSDDHVKAIKKVENVANAQMQASQQFLLATEEVLQREFDFNEEQLRHLEEKLRYMLVSLADVERKGLSILSINDMHSIGEIAEIRQKREEEKQTGIALPEGVKRIN